MFQEPEIVENFCKTVLFSTPETGLFNVQRALKKAYFHLSFGKMISESPDI